MKYFIALFLFLNANFTAAQRGHFQNLALEGGGIRGIAYTGAIEVLDSAGWLDSVTQIAGTSAGAIQAMMLSMGYTSDQMAEIMANVKWETFNDGAYLALGGSYRMIQNYGWYPGKTLRDWCESMIYRKTGMHELTFHQLDSLIARRWRLKKLYVVASDLTIQRPIVLSSDLYPNLAIADAVFASAAIPFYYEPVVLNANGIRIPSELKDSTCHFLVDGGLLANYPYFVFDSFPGRTLGLILDPAERLNPNDTNGGVKINGFIGYSEAIYESVLEMQTQRIKTPEMEQNTIHIGVGNIGPRIRKMKKHEVDFLVNSGKIAARKFIDR